MRTMLPALAGLLLAACGDTYSVYEGDTVIHEAPEVVESDVDTDIVPTDTGEDIDSDTVVEDQTTFTVYNPWGYTNLWPVVGGYPLVEYVSPAIDEVENGEHVRNHVRITAEGGPIYLANFQFLAETQDEEGEEVASASIYSALSVEWSVGPQLLEMTEDITSADPQLDAVWQVFAGQYLDEGQVLDVFYTLPTDAVEGGTVTSVGLRSVEWMDNGSYQSILSGFEARPEWPSNTLPTMPTWTGHEIGHLPGARTFVVVTDPVPAADPYAHCARDQWMVDGRLVSTTVDPVLAWTSTPYGISDDQSIATTFRVEASGCNPRFEVEWFRASIREYEEGRSLMETGSAGQGDASWTVNGMPVTAYGSETWFSRNWYYNETSYAHDSYLAWGISSPVGGQGVVTNMLPVPAGTVVGFSVSPNTFSYLSSQVAEDFITVIVIEIQAKIRNLDTGGVWELSSARTTTLLYHSTN